MQYIFNRVVGPQIEYISQLTIFTESQCNKIASPFRYLFKNKLGLAVTAPNYVTDCPIIYNLTPFDDLQLISHYSKFQK